MNSITVDGNTLIYQSDYNPGLVAALKLAIPATDRRWDPARKAWIVAPQHGRTLVKLTADHLGELIALPQIRAATGYTETRIIEARYIGATKDRGDGAPSAFAYISGQWAAVFPESVLREWFNAAARPDELPTLYAVLGVPAAADAADIKSAYRRLARMWHPDVCREPDAAEQFKRINHAYEVLKAPATRAKYDAGLALAATIRQEADMPRTSQAYRPPLRCGLIMAEGRETLGRFVVEKIIAWQDIVRADGKTLVTSWPMGANAPLENWS